MLAEQTKLPQGDVDHEILQMEEQFTDMAPIVEAFERAPEAEIYGRSLSTPYRLGKYMVGKALSETEHSPEAEQAKVEFDTSVEEGFGTDMELGGGLEVRAFDTRPIIDGRVMAKDLKTAVTDMTLAGLDCAKEKARKEVAINDYRFLPQLQRTVWDHENAKIVDAMARGETDYNTRIVFSPFPEEAAAKSGNEYWKGIGYVPHLRRGFVQVYHATDNGLVAGSLSFDGSNKKHLLKLFKEYGIDIPEDEITDNWLKYAITGTMKNDEAQALGRKLADDATDPEFQKTTNTVEITNKYRPVMDATFRDSYMPACESLARGRQTPEVRQLILQFADKAHHFNDRYSAALYAMRNNPDTFGDNDMIVVHELLVYSTIELMRSLHLRAATPEGRVVSDDGAKIDANHLNQMSTNNLRILLSTVGADGARNGRGYSACGLDISLGGKPPGAGADSPQSAFGGENDDESTERWMSCPHCAARVFADPCAKVLSCWDCKTKVVSGVTFIGKDVAKVRAARAAKLSFGTFAKPASLFSGSLQ